MASPSTASGSVIVIDDDISDEDVAIIASPVARKRRTRPSDVDVASWKLIQKLQEEGSVVEMPSPSRNRRRQLGAVGPTTAASWEQRQREEQDRAFAAKLQQESRALRDSHLKQKVLNSLQPCQRQAMEYVKARAKEMHDKALQRVEGRVIKLGFMSDDLHKCLEYIKNDAPIIVHLQAPILSLLVKDTHYRNVFEHPAMAGLPGREMWENNMFGNSYHNCQPFDRPKYGCLNISGDIAGVKSARGYGTLFMILHQHVRHRCTFFSMDTAVFSQPNKYTLATNEYYAHILDGYLDADLTTALNICKSARLRGAPSQCTTYREVQIHGPLCLATDIQALSISGREQTASKQLKKDVLEFQKMAKCNILWQDDLRQDGVLNPEDDTA